MTNLKEENKKQSSNIKEGTEIICRPTKTTDRKYNIYYFRNNTASYRGIFRRRKTTDRKYNIYYFRNNRPSYRKYQ